MSQATEGWLPVLTTKNRKQQLVTENGLKQDEVYLTDWHLKKPDTFIFYLENCHNWLRIMQIKNKVN